MTATAPTAYYLVDTPNSSATTTTTDFARRNLTELHTEEAQRVIMLVAQPAEPSLAGGLPSAVGVHANLPPERFFVVESPFVPVIRRTISATNRAEIDPSSWRGVFAISAPKRVLFSEVIEARTHQMRRLKPRIVIDRRTLERNDA